ncbi:hypothetical protein [Rhizobium halophilum]|uniref:hypothetical protein n=1 Tax=Rhizobium halophilum TaxID=2846852 RepID=UPI001EFD6DEC|nr:hypothetical protein [Rhizobium halophilum]MCF6370969.1 hypothetical protein [Rhizobium halophilum]
MKQRSRLSLSFGKFKVSGTGWAIGFAFLLAVIGLLRPLLIWAVITLAPIWLPAIGIDVPIGSPALVA